MTDRADDIRVAEILGMEILVQDRPTDGVNWFIRWTDEHGTIIHRALPGYTSFVLDDYSVAEYMIGCSEATYNQWVAALALLQAERDNIQEPRTFTVHNFLRSYQPGDFSRALLNLHRGVVK